MQTVKEIGLVLIIAICIIISYYSITNVDKVTDDVELEYYKLLADIEEANKLAKFPVNLMSGVTAEGIDVKKDKVIYYITSSEGYRPGEVWGPKKKDMEEKLEKVVKKTFCTKSYFQKLPLTVEFRYSVEGDDKNPYDFVTVSVRSQETCNDWF